MAEPTDTPPFASSRQLAPLRASAKMISDSPMMVDQQENERFQAKVQEAMIAIDKYKKTHVSRPHSHVPKLPATANIVVSAIFGVVTMRRELSHWPNIHWIRLLFESGTYFLLCGLNLALLPLAIEKIFIRTKGTSLSYRRSGLAIITLLSFLYILLLAERKGAEFLRVALENRLVPQNDVLPE